MFAVLRALRMVIEEGTGWLAGLVKASSRAVEILPPQKDKKYENLGAVHAENERGTGWFRLTKTKSIKLERLDEGVLAPAAGPQERKHPVIESVSEDNVVRLRTGITTPTDNQYLWVPAYDERALAEALRDALRDIPADSLADRFETRRLDAIGNHPNSNLRVTAEQLPALRACCAPGLQLVWGPPGTGKTHVIVEAVQCLLEAGKTVLLVSNTNIAVDNAVEKLAARPDLPAGQVVRVGTPVIGAVARDNRIALPLLIEGRQRELQIKITDLAERIAALNSDSRISKYREARQKLDDFDLDGYHTAVERQTNSRILGQLKKRRHEAQTGLNELKRKARVADEVAAIAEWVMLSNLELAAADDLAQIERDKDHLESLGWLARRRARNSIATAQRQARRAATRHADAAIARRDCQERLLDRGISDDKLTSYTLDNPSLTDAEQNLRDAKQHAEEFTAPISDAAAKLGHIEYACRGYSELPALTADDRTLLSEADRHGIKRLLDDVPDLKAAAHAATTELATVSKTYEELQEQAVKQRRSAGTAIIKEARMVATTMAMLALNKVVRSRQYDFVIVDEAAACRVPDVIHAVGHARIGAVLVGDYLQNGPIVNQNDKEVRQYFGGDCFAHFGITDPARSQSTAGCAVLTEQRRFGRTVTELVNQAVYDNILRSHNPEPGEIVFIDVDGLSSNLTDIHRDGKYKGQWAVGALLAQTLAEQHVQQRSETIGVVVPYKLQETATKAFLKDSAIGATVEIGTSHAFQGREFDVVLFDMVEDGKGMVANASRADEFRLGGLRLFNVAVTRARKRVYLLGQGAAVDGAIEGPLAVIRRLIAADAITVVRATDVLGIDEAEPPPKTSPEFDVWEALRPYVRVVDLYDQATTTTPLLHRFEQAEKSIWLWSPWAGANRELQDGLIAASDRGVKVTAITLPMKDMTDKQVAGWQQFEERFSGRIIKMVHMHQKIAIVDDRWCFVGSMNLLSAASTISKRRKELMMEIDNRQFAAFLSRHERVRDLSEHVKCPVCRKVLSTVDLRSRQRKREWNWVCCPGRDGCKGLLSFKHQPLAHTSGTKAGWR